MRPYNFQYCKERHVRIDEMLSHLLCLNFANMPHAQYRHLIPAPVTWKSASAWLYKHPWIKSKNKSRRSMTHIACESKLHSVVRSSMHPCSGNWVAIGHMIVYFARAGHTFSVGIRCRHCTLTSTCYICSSKKMQMINSFFVFLFQEDMPYFRRRMIYEIITKKLLQ